MRRRLIRASVSSVLSMSLVLLMIGAAALVAVNAGELSRYIKENMGVTVLMVQDATEGEAADYVDRVSRYSFVTDARLVTREEGARELAEMLGEDFIAAFGTAPVPISAEVLLKAEYVCADSLAWVSDALASSPIVEEVESRQPLVEMLSSNMAKIAALLAAVIAVLMFISYALIANMVRLSVFAKRFTVHTMKLVGATRAFIRAPFMRSAALQGLIAAVIASGALWGAVTASQGSFPQLFAIFRTDTMLIACAAMLSSGVLISMISTYFVVGRLVSASKDDLYY